MNQLNMILSIGASITLLLAVYFGYKLSSEAKHEKYWLLISIGLFLFAIHHWFMTAFLLDGVSEKVLDIVEYWSSIIAGILIAYATYGLNKSMKEVKKKIE